MSEFNLHFTQSASASITVEADTLEEAIEAAWDELPADVCAQCGGWGQTWSLDLDGEWQFDEESAAADYPNGEAS